MTMDYIMAAINEICCGCGYQLRWVWKSMTDEDLGTFYAEGLCKRCKSKE